MTLDDVFVWAYERSCQRYTVIRDALPRTALEHAAFEHLDGARSVAAHTVSARSSTRRPPRAM